MSAFNRFRSIAILIAFLFLAAGAGAQYKQQQGPATLWIQGDKEEDDRIEVRLSSLLSVTLALDGPVTLQVEDIKPADFTRSPFWVLRRVDDPEFVRIGGNQAFWHRTFTLDPQNKGDLPLQIVPLRYRVEAGKGEWQKIEWKPVVIHVTTTVPRADVSQLRDIPGPEPLPESRSRWIPVLRWSGAALVLLAAIMFILQRRRRAGATPELPPHEWAARELARLESMDLPRHGQAERFHTLVSDTIRRYLELRFQLRAPRQTTAEFLEAMRESPHLNAEQRTLLREFLERCDLAKFARAEYSDEECRVTTEMARGFVEQTKPVPAPVPDSPAHPA
jgi:hypothetical protein